MMEYVKKDNKKKVEELKKLSLDKVCSNLYLNYKICRNLNWNVPTSIGDLIFEYYSDKNEKYHDKDLIFFNKEITSLSKIQLYSKHINFIENLCKIDKEFLKEINLSKFVLNTNEVFEINKLISICNNLETINLSGNNGMGIGLASICKQLTKSSKTLKNLNFAFCHIQYKQANYFIKFLKSCYKIESINLSNNCNIGSKFNEIFHLLQDSSETLKVVDFSQTQLKNTQVNCVKSLLDKCLNIQKFRIKIDLKGDGKFLFHSLVKSADSLLEISFENCNFSEGDGKALGSVLRSCHKIELISLSGNKEIGDGIIDVFEGLKSSSLTLKKLSFSQCELRKTQCEALGNLCQISPNIAEVYLPWNPNISEGLEYICNGLIPSCNALRTLNLGYSHLNEYKAKKWLINLLIHCHYLENFSLDGNYSLHNCFSNIFEALTLSQNYLKSLSFLSCALSENHKREFQELREKCPNLHSFRVLEFYQVS